MMIYMYAYGLNESTKILTVMKRKDGMYLLN